MARQIEGVEFCAVGYHAGQIVEAASAAYWLECAGAEDRLANRRDEVRHQVEKLCAVMGLRLVEADEAPASTEQALIGGAA